jgi:transcriptional regulator GlxA family with amidase domain
MTYLKSFRLDKARQALQSGEVGGAAGAAGVTKVALDNGFSHLGRFARSYHARFGELPSATARMKAGGSRA